MHRTTNVSRSVPVSRPFCFNRCMSPRTDYAREYSIYYTFNRTNVFPNRFDSIPCSSENMYRYKLYASESRKAFITKTNKKTSAASISNELNKLKITSPRRTCCEKPEVSIRCSCNARKKWIRLRAVTFQKLASKSPKLNLLKIATFVTVRPKIDRRVGAVPAITPIHFIVNNLNT